MTIGILGKKIGMTQIYTEDGRVVPSSVIEAGPCSVVQIKNKDKDGYFAVQLGFSEKKESRTSKPLLGHFKKAKVKPVSILREIRINEKDEYKVGQQIKADIFNPGDYVDVTGISIGKGFQGGVKRWHWKGGDKSHGSMHHRAPGSIGASSDPSRVFKGHHLPGRMGGEQKTIQNLKVLKVDAENNFLVVKGAIPGFEGNFLVIRKAKKGKKEPHKVHVEKEAEKGKAKQKKKAKK